MNINIVTEGFRLENELEQEIQRDLEWLMADYREITCTRLEMWQYGGIYAARLRVEGDGLDLKSDVEGGGEPDYAYATALEDIWSRMARWHSVQGFRLMQADSL